MNLIVLVFFATATVASAGANTLNRRDVPDELVPDFYVKPGTHPDGNGNCEGVNNPDGTPVLIPCSCPPNRAVFLKSLNDNVAAGHVINNPTISVSFPTGGSKADQQARIDALRDTLQNLDGRGEGCPVESTMYGIFQKYIDNLPNAAIEALRVQA